MDLYVIIALLFGVVFVGTLVYIFVDQRNGGPTPPATISAPPSSDAAVNRATGALSRSDMPPIAPAQPATRRRPSPPIPVEGRSSGRDEILFTPPITQHSNYLGSDGLTDEAQDELDALGGGLGGRWANDADNAPPITTRLPGDPDVGTVRRLPTTQPPIAAAMPARRRRHDRAAYPDESGTVRTATTAFVAGEPSYPDDEATQSAYGTEPAYPNDELTQHSALSTQHSDDLLPATAPVGDADVEFSPTETFAAPVKADGQRVTMRMNPAETGRVFRNVNPAAGNIEENRYLPETRAQQPDRLIITAQPQSRSILPTVIVLLIFLSLISVGAFLFIKPNFSSNNSVTDNQFRFSVATFGDQKSSTDFGNTIVNGFRSAGLNEQQATGSCCTATVRDDAAAKAQIERGNDDLLIWVELANNDSTVTVHYYLRPNNALGLSQQQGVYRQMLLPTSFALPPLIRASMEAAIVDFTAGLALYYSDQAAPAADKFAAAQARGLDAAPLHFYRAASLLQMADYTDAAAEFDHAGAMDDAAMLNNRGLAKFLQQDYAGASADYDAAIAQLGNETRAAAAFRNRALLHIVQGQFATAQADLDLAKAADPRYAPAWFDSCRIAFDINADPPPSIAADPALTACSEAINLDNQYADALTRRGAIFLANSQPNLDSGQRDLAAVRNLLTDQLTALSAKEGQYKVEGSRQVEIIYARELLAHHQLATANYWMGRAYVLRGQNGDKEAWGKAQDMLSEALAQDPNSYDAHTWLGMALQSSGDTNGAAAHFQRAKEIDPARPSAYRQLAELYTNSGQHDKAAAEYEGLLNLNPGYIFGYILLASEYDQLKQPDMVTATYQRAVQQPATTADDLRHKGFAFDQLQDYTNAADNYRQAVALNPKDGKAFFYLANDYRQLGQGDGAITAYRQAAANSYQADVSLYRAGVLTLQANNAGEAEKRWRECLAANAQYLLCYYRLGQMAQASPGRSEEAITLYNQALRANPKTIAGEDLTEQQLQYDIRMQLGGLYMVKGDYANAERVYAEAINFNDDDIPAGIALCNVYIKENKLPEAQSIGQQMSETIDKNNAAGYSCRGRAYLASGDLADIPKAEQQLKQAVSLNPNDVDALIALGRVYVAEGQLDFAEQQYRLALVAAPNSAAARAGLGDVLYARQQFDAAQTEYNAALQLDANSAVAYTGLANVQARQGQYDAATANYRNAIKADPSYADPHLNLALLMTNSNHDGEALSEYEQAVKLRPKWPLARYYLGVAYLRAARPNDAIPHLQAAVQYQPTYPDAYYQLGNAYRAAGPSQRQPAIEAYKKAVEQNATLASAWYSLGLSYEEIGDRANATAAYTQARDTATDPALRRQAEDALARVVDDKGGLKIKD